ncbi:MAG: hypothetical protein HOG89_00745 [Candidatus Peribacter sp.]|jgi:hypothetical protein|nr:hypothetical protein [Candidatus Peribacter sp.]MBT4392949.1 hypothetical protein [Candidatus Peribacter sp.]MBT4601009.1 hypothetical protein [Candidatus Peribacter sp.]MBT5149051.1 hypothetical protein [Candidatus Peribacter sp.]MBT5637375.1 hypothetical protein [Candidatus Peribacter sp.]
MEATVLQPAAYESPVHTSGTKIFNEIREKQGMYYFIVRHNPDDDFIASHLRASSATSSGIFWVNRHDVSGVQLPLRNVTQEAVSAARAKISELGFEITEEYQLI